MFWLEQQQVIDYYWNLISQLPSCLLLFLFFETKQKLKTNELWSSHLIMLACGEICFLSFANFVQAGFMTVVGCHHNYQYRSIHLFGCFARFILAFQSFFYKGIKLGVSEKR